MNVTNKLRGNSDTKKKVSKALGLALVAMVAFMVVSGSAAAVAGINSVSDVDSNGDGSLSFVVESTDSSGTDIRYRLTGDSTPADMSNVSATVVNGAGTVQTVNTNPGEVEIAYTIAQSDVDNTSTVEIEYSGVSSDSAHSANYELLQNTTVIDSGTVNIADTTAPTQYEVSGTVTDDAGNTVSDGTVEILDSNEETVVTSTGVNSDGTYSVDVADGDYYVSHVADGYESGNYSITVNGAAETQDIVVSQLVDYDVDVVDDGTSVDEFTYTLLESDGTEFGSIDKTNGELVTVTQLTVGDEYTAQVTVQEEDADGNMVDVTYEKTFTAEAPADGSSAVSQTLDINTMNEVSDDDGTTIIDSGGETASTLFEQLVQGVEDTLSVSADLALVLGGFVLVVIGVVVVVFFRGLRSSF